MFLSCSLSQVRYVPSLCILFSAQMQIGPKHHRFAPNWNIHVKRLIFETSLCGLIVGKTLFVVYVVCLSSLANSEIYVYHCLRLQFMLSRRFYSWLRLRMPCCIPPQIVCNPFFLFCFGPRLGEMRRQDAISIFFQNQSGARSQPILNFTH